MTPSLKARLPNEIKRRVFRRIFVDVGRGLDGTIFIAGSGRSGTTWLADIINHRNDYRLLFEPFHPAKVPLWREFRYKQYMRPDQFDDALFRAARRILTGRIRDPWIDSRNRSFISRKRLVKDIRAHNMLKWLHVHFPAVRFVLLLRHPCAVASSRLTLGWASHLEALVSQHALVEDFLAPVQDRLERASDPFEQHVIEWCIENTVALRHFAPSEIHVMFFEHLCLQPEREVERICQFAGITSTRRVLKSLHVPSSETRRDSAVMRGANPASAWTTTVSAQTWKRALEIMRLFGLDAVYPADWQPNSDGLAMVMRPPS